MGQYAYMAKDLTGRTVKGYCRADDSAGLVARLSEQNLFCISYDEAPEDAVKVKYRYRLKDLAFLCRQLGTMLSSGMALVKALAILQRDQTKRGAAQSLQEIYEEVQKGRLLSESMDMQHGAFPEFFTSMVAAGEVSGTLDAVMRRLSDHYAKENRTHNKIRAAMVYPIILFSLSLVVVIALFVFIMPVFMDLFQGAELPPLTQFMMNISGFLRTRWYVLLAVLAVLGLLVYQLRKLPSIRVALDKMKLKAPWFGPLVTKVYTARFALTLSALYSSGIPIIECLEKTVAVLGNSYITERFDLALGEIRRGGSLSEAIAHTNIFEKMFCSIIYVGEESGDLDNILVKTAEYYEEESDSAIQRGISMLEPLMIIVLGMIVCLVLVSIIPAIYQMYGSI